MSAASRPALILAGLLLLVPASAAQTAGPRSRPGARAHHVLKHLADKLGLSGAQRDQIKALALQHKDQMVAARKAMRSAKQSLQKVLDATPQDADAVRAAARALSAAQEDLAVARGARRAEVRSVLTPEQQQQVAARQQARAERRADRAQALADGHGKRHKKLHKHGHKKPQDRGPQTPPK